MSAAKPTKKTLTKPLGRGTSNITANIPNDLYLDIDRLASTSGSGKGEYIRSLLELAAAAKLMLRDNPQDRVAWEEAVAAGLPRPKIRKQLYLPHEGGVFTLNYDALLSVALASVVHDIGMLPEAAGQVIKRSVETPVRDEHARMAKAVTDVLCPPPDKFRVQPTPQGPVYTTGKPGASQASPSLNEDAAQAARQTSAPKPGPKPRSTRGIHKASRAGQAGQKS